MPMNNLPKQNDADFYTLVHQLVAETEGGQQDRRRRRRHPFVCDQWIAPQRDGRLPEAGEFFEVHCRDLNASGISFLLPEPPEFREFVVALSAPPATVYLEALVSHWVEVLLWPSGRIERLPRGQSPQDGARTTEGAMTMYQVGARFTRRLAPEVADPTP